MDPSTVRRAFLTAARRAAGSLLLAVPLFAGPALAAPQGSLTVSIIPQDVWPPAPVTDLVAVPGAEGQMLLSWTAPDSNGDFFAVRSPAAGYQIRIASFSVDDVGGSTTTWWARAADVRALTAPAIGGDPPAPGPPGAMDSMLLSQLEPGVTVYAMAVSSDSAGQFSDSDLPSRTPSAQAKALVFDAVPPAPASITALPTGPASILVAWPASPAYDLDFYRLRVDSTTPYDFADGYVVEADSPTPSITLTGLAPGAYAFRVSAVDKGLPSYAGLPLESAATSSTTATLQSSAQIPQTPFGLALSSAGAAVILVWMPVQRFDDGAPFGDPLAATAAELTGYRVYRATSVVAGSWIDQVALSSSVLTWTDVAGGPQYFYHVRAENDSGLSGRSVFRSVATLSAFAVAPDDRSYLEVTAPSVSSLEGVGGQAMTAYLVEASSRPEDLGGRVVKSVEFSAKQGGLTETTNFELPGMGRLKLRYELGVSSVVAASAAAAVPSAPANLGVFWYNGSRWVQMYGALDQTDQTLNLETKYLGVYQLRVVERAAGFAFDQAGVSNRFVTPNGDGKNDTVVFTYENPRELSVRARILDLRGRVIVSELPPGPVTNSRVWDGRGAGGYVPGGAYLYQIEAEGRVFSGTIVILK
ncbi:MAG: hypothetical protein Q8T11_04475 [Elusimicrobiota bacterium]|nr:hypothetical protein [Elusimicrobiota bacterium]